MLFVVCALLAAGFAAGDAYVLHMSGHLPWRESWARSLVTWEIGFAVALELLIYLDPRTSWSIPITWAISLPLLWGVQWFFVRQPIRRARETLC